ncbi:hypothetical protein EDC18_10544 [Natranaerovirga pectinivora]|uniref:AP2 domain-containing protein n=1 Tax=Natranaerovirga pectinivora TaxID=682400 RepID=A0A4V2V078_9FIRM|nr:hypothetical protein [Natranaerovirga pectinivora]TCT14563.1 hypothetical protein EDC18_10544 [Natranaerovirga pectinivora]
MKYGDKYNNLVVIGKTVKKKGKSYLWEFKCDCGNTVYYRACDVKSGSTKSCGCLKYKRSIVDDITGKLYGKLTVIRKTDKKTDGRYLWQCKCDCDKIVYVSARALKSGNTSSCGCKKYDDARKVDYTGKRFEKLTVIKRDENIAKWICKCDCGKEIIVYGNRLKNGKVKSCGCLPSEIIIRRNKYELSTHRMTGSRLYNIWDSMKARCLNSNSKDYHNYGQRGITIYEKWLKFESFMEWATKNGYQEKLTLDRIDVNGNYEPSNCRWVSTKVQGNNTRVNRRVTMRGRTQTLSQWADEIGISPKALRYRIEAGWKEEDIFSPVDSRKKRIK